MNYFNNTFLGMDLLHDDLRYIQDSLIKGILALPKAFGIPSETSYILDGCSPTLSTILHITEGWVFLSGELLYVPAQDVNYISTKYYIFQKQTSLDTAGERDNYGVIVNPYQVNQAMLIQVGNIASGQLAYNGATLHQLISKKLLFVPQWHKVGDQGNLQLGSGFTYDTTSWGLNYKLTNSGDLHIFGNFTLASDTSSGSTLVLLSLLDFYQLLDDSVEIVGEGFGTYIYINSLYKINLRYQKDNTNTPPSPRIFDIAVELSTDLQAGTPFSINLTIPLNLDNTLKISPYDN